MSNEINLSSTAKKSKDVILEDLCNLMQKQIAKFNRLDSDFLTPDLLEILVPLKGKRVKYVVSPGNIGDYLIELGSLTLLNSFELTVEVTESFKDCAGEIVFFQGGGGFHTPYDVTEKLLQEIISSSPKQIIVLPSTIRSFSAAIHALRSHDIVIARDTPTLDFLHESKISAEVKLSHDAAFFVDFAHVLIKNLDYQLIVSHLDAESNVKFPSLDVSRVGIILRNDIESATKTVTGSTDISSFYSWGESQESRLLRLVCFLIYLSNLKFLVTDRLHVAIACHLLEIPCVLIDNSYGKNLGVYSYSLENSPFVIFQNEIRQIDLWIWMKHRSLMGSQREELTQQRDELTQQRDELTQQRDELTQQRDELTQQRDELTQQRDELLNSTIWILTEPIRWFINLIKR